ncbi:MAG: hypothetical protein CMC08_00540 [Flavobacteriaceae bacterium]|nr:hypothetical protein [Flavobacteriaceae bacterium]
MRSAYCTFLFPLEGTITGFPPRGGVGGCYRRNEFTLDLTPLWSLKGTITGFPPRAGAGGCYWSNDFTFDLTPLWSPQGDNLIQLSHRDSLDFPLEGKCFLSKNEL